MRVRRGVLRTAVLRLPDIFLLLLLLLLLLLPINENILNDFNSVTLTQPKYPGTIFVNDYVSASDPRSSSRLSLPVSDVTDKVGVSLVSEKLIRTSIPVRSLADQPCSELAG